MKNRRKQRRSAGRPPSNLVPAFEQCLSFVMSALSHSRDGEKRLTLTPTEKHRFNQMERKTDLLDLDPYRDLLRRVLAPGLQAMSAESGVLVATLQAELREFFKRYEILHWQIVPGLAGRGEVLWVLSHRFFVPWLALRLAFRLRDDADIGADFDDCWFIPLRRGDMYSCMMKVIDRFVRRVTDGKVESNSALTRRLHGLVEGNINNKRCSAAEIIERTQKQDQAERLDDNISKYAHFKTSPENELIENMVAITSSVPDLRLMLVLARFIDRCVHAALKVFDASLVLELLNYFALCFAHCRSVLKLVRSEHPAAQPENVWGYLNSWTYLGNTPGQQERFSPLLDEYMNELARKMNAELRRSVRSGEPCRLPRDEIELNAGQWRFPKLIPIPVEIENAPFRETVGNAVAASLRTFQGRVSIPQAVRARRIFAFTGLETFALQAEGLRGRCTIEEATLALEEAKRLYQLIYDQASVARKPRIALGYLKFLIEPYRPKALVDGKLARNLLVAVTELLCASNLHGAAKFLEGSIHALEGNERLALRSFSRARKLGRESCGKFWIELLRAGLLMAERVGSDKQRGNFAKQARLFGVFSSDATPRTNELRAQMKEDGFRRAWTAGFKPFPRPV